MSKTVRVVSDRVPVVSVGRTNPPLKKWRGRGSAADNKRRRGAMAHGVVYGPKQPVNLYKIPRDNSGGPLGRMLQTNGRIMAQAEDAYLRFYVATLKAHGWVTPSLNSFRRR